MKKIVLFSLAMLIILFFVSCENEKEVSTLSENSNNISQSQQTESLEESAEESSKSILDMTTEELEVLFEDVKQIDLKTTTGSANLECDLELKQTGLTETYKVIINEKTSVRGDGTMKRAFYQNVIGYQLDVKTEYIFDDGMAYIYTPDTKKFKSTCSLEEFEEYLESDFDEELEPDYTMKAIEATNEYVVLEVTLELTDNSTQYTKAYFETIIPSLLGIDCFDDFTLVSCTQTTKIVGDFIESIKEAYVAKITIGETEYEVNWIGEAKYSETDPIITVPDADDGYFELPRINAMNDFAKATNDFYLDDFISFKQNCDFKITSKNENYNSISSEFVQIICPEGVLKFKIISDLEENGEKSQSTNIYDGNRFVTILDGERESFSLSQDEAYGVLTNYYTTIMLIDLEQLSGVKEENGVLNVEFTINDVVFESIANSLINGLFAAPENVVLNEAIKKEVIFNVKDEVLLSTGYNVSFTCNVGNELYTLDVTVNIGDIKQIDESLKEIDV